LKISEFKTFVVGNPPPHYMGRYFIFVKLVTDNGIEGFGEVYGLTPFGPHTIARMIEDVCERHAVGADPFGVERMWRTMYSAGFSMRPDISLLGVMSGIEMACWDIVGKALEKPVYELLGGRVHERLRTYTTLVPAPASRDPDFGPERALHYVELGFTALKFDPFQHFAILDPRQPTREALDGAERVLRNVREAVGTRADLLIGTHGQFTTAAAIRIARRLAPYYPLWFEEPTPPEMPEQMARVARASSIPIAAGERLTTKYEFARLLEHDAASIIQMDLGRVGGLVEAKKIAGMAETHYAQIAPHLCGGPIVGAANIQLAACSPNFLVLEGLETWSDFNAEILKTALRWEEGFIIPPTAPGLGVELDEEVAARHPYDGDQWPPAWSSPEETSPPTRAAT
jgi:galactonate dehydratase